MLERAVGTCPCNLTPVPACPCIVTVLHYKVMHYLNRSLAPPKRLSLPKPIFKGGINSSERTEAKEQMLLPSPMGTLG